MFGYVWLLGSCLAQKLDKKNWSHGCKEVFGGLSQRDLSQNIPMMCTESSTRHQRNCPDQAQGCLFQSVLMTNYINYILNHSTVVLAHGFLWKAAVFFFFFGHVFVIEIPSSLFGILMILVRRELLPRNGPSTMLTRGSRCGNMFWFVMICHAPPVKFKERLDRSW